MRAALLLLVLGVVLLAGSLLDARRRIVDLEERLVALELQQAMCARDASAAWLDHLAVTGELARLGVAEAGQRARALLSVDRPALDWVALARGMGVPARTASTAASR